MVNNGSAPSGSTSASNNTLNRTPISESVTDSDTISTTQCTIGGHNGEGIFAGETVKQIEPVVKLFRTDKIKKSLAIYRIGQILAAGPTGNEGLKSDTLEQYAVTLDWIESLATSVDKHGARVTVAGTMHERRVGESSKRSRQHAESDRHTADEPQENNVDSFLAKLSKGLEPGMEQEERGEGSKDDSEQEADDTLEERGRSNKKQKIYESQMPWFSPEQQIRKSVANRSCNKTRQIIETLQRDPATVKRWIRCATSAPAGFPSSEWDVLIKGESVDIDTVFSSLHHIHRVDESIGHVGTTEIQFGRLKPAARVEMSGQWTSAYNIIVKATLFLFPHRYNELRRYGDYIEELFSVKSVSIHPKLFCYDAAVKYKAGQGQNILLTNREQFMQYYEAIVAPDGVGIDGTSSDGKGAQSKGGKPGAKSDICHRFNGKNGCKLAAGQCKYKHICKKCKQSGHGKVECKVNEAV